MNKIWINRRYICKKTTQCVFTLYAILGFISLFVSFESFFSSKMILSTKVILSILFLSCSWLVLSFFVCGYCFFKRRVEVICTNNGNKLYVQYGDLFGENETIDRGERRNIVIPVNRCFDTIVDNVLISEKTLHGIMLKRLYEESVYTVDTLNSIIEKKLKSQSYELLEEDSKPYGNNKRYDIGTVVDIPKDEHTHFILWGLSTFNQHLKAHTTMQDYALAVQKLIEACNTESEGFPIMIPLVGAGLSRTNRSQTDILEYLVKAFKLNRSNLNCDIHIIVREDLKEEIAIMGL